MFKYVHLFLMNEKKFSIPLIEFINSSDELKPDNHIYVTPFEEVYNEISDYDNTLLFDEIDYRTAKYVNYWGDRSEWIFVHHLPSPIEAIRIRRSVAQKIIWRTWGGDTGYNQIDSFSIKNIIKRMVNHLFRSKVSQFKVIGIANYVDVVDLKRWYPNSKFFLMPYGLFTSFSSFLSSYNVNGTDITRNVMVGHSGFSEDNHIAMVDLICSIKGWDLCNYFFILSYGEPEYIEKVKEYAISKLGDRCNIIDYFMEEYDYYVFLSKMDVAIFDGLISYALGNIEPLLAMHKKIVLNENGILKEAFDNKSIPYETTQTISGSCLESFMKPLDYSNSDISGMIPMTIKESTEAWMDVLEYLDSKVD